MVCRRDVLAGAFAAVASCVAPGCVSESRRSSDSGDVSYPDAADVPLPVAGDLAVEAVPRGGRFRHSEEPTSGEFVWIENVATVAVSLAGVRLEYPDGTQYVLDDELPLDLPAGGEVYVFSDDRRPVQVLTQPPTLRLGADLPNRPLLDDRSTVTLHARDEEVLATDSTDSS